MANLNEGAVNLFMVYQFLKRLATPFNKWPAYKQGVIDEKGNILIKKNDRHTYQQRDSFKTFDVMILKLKRLLGKIPGGKTRIASYAASLWLIKEDWQNMPEEYLLTEGTELDVDFLSYMREARNKKFQEFIAQISNEEAPANAAGGGNVAGLGVNGPSDVKISRNVRKTMYKRKKRTV